MDPSFQLLRKSSICNHTYSHLILNQISNTILGEPDCALLRFTEDLANLNEIVFIDAEISKYCCNEKTNKAPEKVKIRTV